MNNFKKYPSYKDSEIEWLKKIPSHWELIRLGSEFEERRDKVSDKDFEALSVTKNGIVPQLENAAKSNDGDNRKGVRKGDFVINSRSDRKGSSGIAYQDGSVSLINIVLKPKSIFPKYSEYLLKSYHFIEEFYRYGHGIVADLWTTRYSEMKAMPIPLPPLEEQTAIANFLDKKTAEIKEFIALKEKTIELLKERKMAIINQAVTKGLDPTVEMKDSGIEWLGEIPKHWEKVRIGHYVNVFRGASPRPAGDPTLFGGDFMPWITVSEVTKKGEKYLYETETYLTQLGAKQSRFVYPEMLLLSNSGASLGVPKISLIKGCFNDGSVAFDKYNAKLQRDFLYHFFNSHTEIYRREMAGYGQPNLNTDIIKSTKIPLPPIDEQHAICKYIDSKTEEFNEIIKQTDKEIELIKEYQQSLISEVVTGKVDVNLFTDKE